MRKTNGITLIALVITIIVLLILAGVSIAMLTGENGILTQAQRAKNETEKAQADEENILGDYENYLSQYTNGGYVESKGVNAPVLKDGMELVTYNEETKNWDTNNSSSAYDYVAGEGTDDNNSSRWANAKVTIDGVDSYFVWIPRYAYKITYNNPDDISQGGKIDVKFLIGTSDNYYDDEGNLQTAKRATTGHEDTTSDYYVHPAFTNNVDLGGWRNELTGIWVGKYESARDDVTSDNEGTSTKIKVQPGVVSCRNMTIGDMYTNARQYAEELNSHMLKNSEWGAVAYLTHSQYGRNSHEIDINNNENYITADEGIDINPTQSSTGNVYGIYDLSGGSYEYVAVYYNGSEKLLNGNSFAMKGGASTEYATVYTRTIANTAYKLGDATYETSRWNGDDNYFIWSDKPFCIRGGYYNLGTGAGIMGYDTFDGSKNYSFRMCLAI